MLYKAALGQFTASDQQLGDSLAAIERWLAVWWAQTRLTWFTDHGPRHSRRVVEAALEVAAALPDPLTLIEQYVLCAAALLHDCGMQDVVIPGLTVDQLQPRHHTVIRQRHPQRSAELIIENRDNIGIVSEPEFWSAVSLIARAHGSEEFEACLPTLDTLGPPRNEKPFRPSLLAGILLMADELDLHATRANLDDPRQVKQSALSRAHNFRHHYVSEVRLTRGRLGGLRIDVTFQFPEDLEDAPRRGVARWTAVKLRQQIGMVNPVLASQTGWVGFERAVGVAIQTEPVVGAHRIMDSEAWLAIEEELARADVVDYSAHLRNLEPVLDRSRVLAIVARDGQDDPDGREDILRWLCVRASRARTVVRSDTLRVSAGGTLADVLQEWLGARATARGETDYSRLASALADKIAEGTLLVVSSTDRLDAADRAALFGSVLPLILERCRSVAVAYSDSEIGQAIHARFGSHEERLGTPAVDEVAAALRAWMDPDAAKAAAQAGLGYANLKALISKLALARIS